VAAAAAAGAGRDGCCAAVGETPLRRGERGTDNRWHARIRNAEPPVTVADDHLDGLREEIVRKLSQLETADCERRGAS
jgi:hypothetical protein